MITMLILTLTLSGYLFYKRKPSILDFSFYYTLYLFISVYIRGIIVISQGSSDIFDHIGYSFSPDLLDILLVCVVSICSQFIVFICSPKFKYSHESTILQTETCIAG